MKSIESESASERVASTERATAKSGTGKPVVSHRIRSTFPLSPLLEALARPRTAAQALRMALTAFRYFFYPQFETKLFPKKRPVANVDHPLDEEVPFRPDLVKEYLTFFFLWINTGMFFARGYGRAGVRAYSSYINEVVTWYREAGSVYLRKQSTTRRPPDPANGFFKVIHSLDPHLHCVPSLHIIIAVGNWIMGRRLLAQLSGGKPGPREDRALTYIRQECIRISESVLYVKQHSVNCVGATIFYLRAKYPEEFGDEEIKRYMAELYTYEGDDLPLKQEIKDYIYSLYLRLWRKYEKAGDGDWRRVLLSFLGEFKVNPPFGK